MHQCDQVVISARGGDDQMQLTSTVKKAPEGAWSIRTVLPPLVAQHQLRATDQAAQPLVGEAAVLRPWVMSPVQSVVARDGTRQTPTDHSLARRSGSDAKAFARQ